jgi:hypothetical protein
MLTISLPCWMTLMCMCVFGFIGLEKVQAQVLTSQETVIIVDVEGKSLGPVFFRSQGYIDYLVFYIDPFVVPVTVMKNKIIGHFPAWFESTDCSGNPVIDAEEATGIPFDSQMVTPATVVAQVFPNQGVLGKIYVADPNNSPHQVTVRSKAADPGCVENENQPALVVDTLEFMDLDAQFTPPFKAAVVSEPPTTPISKKGKGPKKK